MSVENEKSMLTAEKNDVSIILTARKILVADINI